nr:zinc finger protein ZPR1 [Seculamonas ecuadoriensis]
MSSAAASSSSANDATNDVPQDSGELYHALGDDILRPTEIESLCMECGENGMTRLLLTTIPHFREVILSSFHCEHCGCKNSEVQFGGVVAPRGIEFELTVDNPEDMDRQIVKSAQATVHIPEIELEIPPNTGERGGVITTVEGLFLSAAEDLEDQQPVRKIMQPEVHAKIESFIEVLRAYAKGRNKFTVILRDPAGNSHIQNPNAPAADPALRVTHFDRTPEENAFCGLAEGDEQAQAQEDAAAASVGVAQSSASAVARGKPKVGGALLSDEASVNAFMKRSGLSAGVETPEEVIVFPENCHMCQAPGECRMIVTNIPYFKEIVLMAFKCDQCGYKSTEVKPGGAISAKGRRITLRVTNEEDMARDVLKSESATVLVPELELELGEGTLGGMFTTIEGLLLKAEEQLRLSTGAFMVGDSSDPEHRARFAQFLERLREYATGVHEFTIIIDDPLANSHLQNVYAPDDDPNMTVEDYTRTHEQDDELGLLDMKTENYHEHEEAAKHEEEHATDAAVQPSS